MINWVNLRTQKVHKSEACCKKSLKGSKCEVYDPKEDGKKIKCKVCNK